MSSFGLPPAERGDCVHLPNAPAVKQKSREEMLSEFAYLLEASLESAPIAEATGHAATATSLPVAARFRERALGSVRTVVEATKPFDNGPKPLSTRTSYTETDAAAADAEPTWAVGAACVPRQKSGVAEEMTTGRSRRRKLRATALVLVSAGSIGAIIVLQGGALSLSKESRVIAEAGPSALSPKGPYGSSRVELTTKLKFISPDSSMPSQR